MTPRPSGAVRIRSRSRTAARRRTRCHRRPRAARASAAARRSSGSRHRRCRSGPACPRREPRYVSSARRSARSTSAEPALVGEAEEQRERLLLGLVRAEHLAEQLRPEVGDRRAHRDAVADPAEREELDRIRGRLVRQARGRPSASAPGRPLRPGRPDPRDRPCSRRRRPRRRRRTAARRSAAAFGSCRSRSRRRSARAGSSSPSAAARAPSASTAPS